VLSLLQAESGRVLIGSLKESAAREVVPEWTNDRQHPVLNFEGTANFIVDYYAGGDTKPKGLPFNFTWGMGKD